MWVSSTSSPWTFLFVISAVSAAVSRNLQTSTSRSQPSRNETVIHLPSPTNISDVLDVRTPPRIQQMMKRNEHKHELAEKSHPGVAEPIDEDSFSLDDSLKKMNFHKTEPKSTTDSGLSTWILLSGQTISSTPKTVKNNVKAVNETKNITIENPNRIVKPVFKKKSTINGVTASSVSSTVKPTSKEATSSTQNTLSKFEMEKTTKATTTSTSTVSSIRVPSSTPAEVTKLVKVKPSVLNKGISSTNNSNVTNVKNEKKKEKDSKLQSSTAPTLENSTKSSTVSADNLKAELKDGDLDLSSQSTTSSPKKSRRPSQKKKKDKNRRRRPAVEEKVDNNNKTKVATKDKPISTQIYNYLAREVMPSVGVGLVGLVVTAGLASYFLYPFGTLRRSYEVDRRDKDNVYYYENEYFGGVPEEEAIGKVIAGMPLYTNEYRQKTTSKNTYSPANRYRYSDSSNYYSPQATVEEVQLDPLKDYKHDGNYLQETYQTNEVHKNEPITYSKDVISKNVEAAYTTSDQQYVVGNVPKEIQEVTPVAVPEHGPRSLKFRRRKRETVPGNKFGGNTKRFKGVIKI